MMLVMPRDHGVATATVENEFENSNRTKFTGGKRKQRWSNMAGHAFSFALIGLISPAREERSSDDR